jgi:hypothetical protein
MFKFFSGSIFIIALLTLAACGIASQTLTGTERDQVLAYAEPKTDNLLNSLNNNDYASFKRDLNSQLTDLIPADEFVLNYQNLGTRVGKYISREIDHVERGGDYITVLYRAKFEKEDNVTVRVIYEVAGDHRVAGLWFDSPKIRSQVPPPQ